MKIDEKYLESKLAYQVKRYGGLTFKNISPYTRGIPDRTVITTSGKVVFVELKTPGCKPSPLQQVCIDSINALGAKAIVIDSLESLNAFLFQHFGPQL